MESFYYPKKTAEYFPGVGAMGSVDITKLTIDQLISLGAVLGSANGQHRLKAQEVRRMTQQLQELVGLDSKVAELVAEVAQGVTETKMNEQRAAI